MVSLYNNVCRTVCTTNIDGNQGHPRNKDTYINIVFWKEYIVYIIPNRIQDFMTDSNLSYSIFSGLVREQLISIPPRLTGKRFWYDIVLLLFYPYISNSDRRPLHNTRKKPTWLASDFSDIGERVHHIRQVQMEKWEALDLRMEGIGSSPRSLYGLATRAIIQHFKRCTYLHILGLNHMNWSHTFQQTIP